MAGRGLQEPERRAAGLCREHLACSLGQPDPRDNARAVGRLLVPRASADRARHQAAKPYRCKPVQDSEVPAVFFPRHRGMKSAPRCRVLGAILSEV
jgi:hypothetical protein